MPQLLRLASLAACLGMALLPAHAPAADSDTELEARIAAMGRIGSAGGGQYSPDGSRIAYITNLGGVPQVWWIPAEGGYPRAVTSGGDAASGVRWSPDGRLAYAVSPGGGYNAALLLTAADGTGTRAIDDDGDANTFVGEFTRDGRYLLLSIWANDGALIVYDSQTLKEIKRIPMNKPSGKYNVGNKVEFAEGTSH